MNVLPLMLQIIALICLIAAAVGLWPTSKVQWGWLGMALWLFSLMIGGVVLHQVS